ncbi:NAD(P)/FAD-dependent oxidoreductase [Polymorphospora rubra]|uniref:FAD/NAD(P)-dependent oxidoreductase n=1 Tax=Polymorphospora rubra TaxID=338584 RepID=UPI001BB44417|nr:NAD(P)/FAD-dependent oxidoreductase [Polymorphospora rubra]
MTSSRFDVAVVGAGPGGLAAAEAAVGAGARVALVDGAGQPGGQYWRHPAGDLDAVADLHHGLKTFRAQVRAVDAATTFFGHQVWTIEKVAAGFVVRAVVAGTEVEIAATSLVLAPGAYDRQLPFPGWDLPGVYTAGGAQALLKGNQVLAGRRVVVGGTGPFLLPVASGLAARGAKVAGVFEANSPLGWVRRLPAVLPVAGKLTEGAGYTAALARHRVPYRSRHAIVAAHGTDRVTAVTVARLDRDWRIVAGSQQRVECDAVAVGWGFTPQLELPLAVGCATRVDVDGSVVVQVDEAQRSSVPGVYVAGEACGVGGAALATVEGAVAGRAAAAVATGRAAGAGAVPRRLVGQRNRLRAFASAMHRTHPVRDGWRDWLTDETLVCRCEEVSAGRLREATDELGATDARSAKLLSRAGMGWCQGRVCGYATSCLVAAWSGRPFEPGAAAERPVAVPIPLGLLSQHPGT